MADNVQLQGIEFQIVGESDKAAKGLKSLTTQLNKIKSITSDGLGLKKIMQELKDFNSAFGDSPTSGLADMASSVAEIAKSSRSIMTVRGHLQGIADLDFSNLQTAAQSIGTIAQTAGWGRGSNPGSGSTGSDTSIPTDLPTGMPETEHVEGTTAAVEQAGQAFEGAARAEQKAASSGKEVRQVLVNVAKQFKNGAVNAGKFGLKVAALPFKKLAANIKGALAPMKQFMSSIARIGMYRAIRSLLSGVTTALKEGTKNLYEYSRAVGTTFHTAMNTASTDALWLKNSFAAAVAPIVESLMPALDALAAKVAQVLNLVAQLMAILSGRSTYSKAIKSAKEYGAATGGAAKELRMLISGFDELNAFPDSSGGGGGGADFSGMFEEAAVDSEIGDFVKQLKAAFEAGDWEGLGKLLGDKVNEIVDKIKWKKIGSKLGKGIDAVIRTAYSFLKTVNFKKIGAGIADILNGAFEEIHFETAGRLFIRKITALLDTIIGFIMQLDWGLVAKSIGDFFKGVFREAAEWVRENDFGEIARTMSNGVIKILDALLEAVREIDWLAFGKAIGDFLSNIDWLGILSRVAQIVWEVFKGVLEGLLSTNGGRMFLLLLASIKGLKLAFTLTEGLFSAAVQRWVMTGISPLESMPAMVSEIGGKVTSVLGTIAKGIGTAALGVFDAVLIAYDVKSLTEAANTYNSAQVAHNRETENALTSYANLYETKGKEVADQWAAMAYELDTTNMNFDQAQAALTQKIEGYWDGVPQNMWEGFKQGWNSYFGEGGSGLFGLLGDAFTGAVDGIKNLLGIHSPSTVFYDMGTDLVTGLFNAISDHFGSITDFFTEGFSTLLNTASTTWSNIKEATATTWANIKSDVTDKITQTKNNVVTNLNTLRSNISSAWNNAKSTTVSAWTSMTSSAKTKFQEIYSTVQTKMNNATSHLRSIQWGSIGSNLVSGLLNGLRSAWNSVTSWVSNAASGLTNTLKNVFRIGSPSKVWAEIGTFLDAGLEQGLEGGTRSLLSTAGNIATALTGAMTPTLPSPAAVAAGFNRYGVDAPAISGYEGYEEDGMSGVESILAQMFEFMQTADWGNGDRKFVIDGREVFNAVVKENSRAIQRTGASPIRV